MTSVCACVNAIIVHLLNNHYAMYPLFKKKKKKIVIVVIHSSIII